jgi:hypothetical protein
MRVGVGWQAQFVCVRVCVVRRVRVGGVAVREVGRW